MDWDRYLEQTAHPGSRSSDYRRLVQQYYDAVDLFYRWGWGERFHFAPFVGDEPVQEALRAQEDVLVAAAGIRTGMRVLDVGCGVGGPARWIARTTGASVLGITISPAQLEAARRLTRRQGLEASCRFDLVDAMTMAYEDGSFDAIYSIEAICHLPDKPLFFSTCRRLLKPGGVVAGWDWISGAGLSPEDRTRLVEPICRYFALPGLLTLGEMGAALASAGLTVARLEDMGERGRPDRRWWAPLERRLRNPLTRLGARLSRTTAVMRDSGRLLVSAGRAGAFSPLGFFLARRPASV